MTGTGTGAAPATGAGLRALTPRLPEAKAVREIPPQRSTAQRSPTPSCVQARGAGIPSRRATARAYRRLVLANGAAIRRGDNVLDKTRATTPSRVGERGSVTAETAVALPALVVVMAVALWGVSAAAAQVACLDAARAGARAAARGEPEEEVRSAVLDAAPPNARVLLSRDASTTKVIVRAETRSPLKGLFPSIKLEAQAVAATEPRTNDTGTPAVGKKPQEPLRGTNLPEDNTASGGPNE
jgi:hypothetical protein